MSFRFPHDVAYMARTKLCYIHLPGLLSDGKRDRSARVSGFVAIDHGQWCELIFMRAGEPFNAGRIGGGERGIRSMSQTIDQAVCLAERGESGHVGYYGASENQLRSMLATLVSAPVVWREEVQGLPPERLFTELATRRFSGVLEAFEACGAHHYLTFREGRFQQGFLSDGVGGGSVGQGVQALFEHADRPPKLGLYPLLAELPAQASPELIDVYRSVLQGLVLELARRTSRGSAVSLLREAGAAVLPGHPAVTDFVVADDGAVRGDSLASRSALTAALAAWVMETLAGAADRTQVDPPEVLEVVTRGNRLTLSEQGFFRRLPWPIST